MSLLQSVILGIIQGLTEFLPISSSGHLVLAPWLLGWELDPQATFVFDVLVQWGTLLAVVVYFRQDLLGFAEAILESVRTRSVTADARLAWFLLISTIPAAVIGLLLKPLVEQSLEEPLWVSLFLFLTAGLLLFSERAGRRQKNLDDIHFLDALVIGIFQILALFPGVSRSGSTISGGLFRQFDRKSAARFSFLMALPVMVAAGSVAIYDLISAANTSSQIAPLLAGTLAAAIVGYLAIDWLFTFISRHSLNLFAFYCIGMGLIGILVVVARG